MRGRRAWHDGIGGEMKCPHITPQFGSSSLLPMVPSMSLPLVFGRTGGDTRMLDIYNEYGSIISADEPVRTTKKQLANLAAFADSQGLTGVAAYDGLRRLCAYLHEELMDTRGFSLFYRFVFFMCREQGQKSIAVSTALLAWRLTLTGRFRLLDQWLAFVKAHQRQAISEDTWRQVLEFSRSVHEDLSNYDPEGAWPVLVDEFVDKMYSLESAAVCNPDNELSSKLTSEDEAMTDSLSSKPTTLPGMVAGAGSKRRRRDPKDVAAQAESVNSIAQLFAEMPSPISCKRVRSSEGLVDVPDPMDEGSDSTRVCVDQQPIVSLNDGMSTAVSRESSGDNTHISSTPGTLPPWPRFIERIVEPSPDVSLSWAGSLECDPQTRNIPIYETIPVANSVREAHLFGGYQNKF